MLRNYSLITLLIIVLVPIQASAEAVPKHLASMAQELYLKTSVEMDWLQDHVTPEEKSALIIAKSIIRRAGVSRWASSIIVQQDAAKPLAESLGLDLNDENDWLLLKQLTEAKHADKQAIIKKILAKQKKENKSGLLNKAASDFDAAQSGVLKDMKKRHKMTVAKNEDITIQWKPEANKIEIVVDSYLDLDKKEGPFQIVLSGYTIIRPTKEGDHLRIYTYANDPGVRVLTEDKLKKIQESIFGIWETEDGTIWEVTKLDGSIPPRADRQSQDTEIKRLENEIKGLKKNKVYVWKHEKSGEVLRQTKFKKLGEDYTYEGEAMAADKAEDKIKALQEKIAGLNKEAELLPVDAHDPLNETELELDDPQPLKIKVTNKDGYSFTYRRAYFDGKVIKADRTLADIKDITTLPKQVVAQLIASWSPPEWAELEAKLESPSSPQIILDGTRWRLHVTYEAPYFGMGDYEVKSIHTPYPTALRLTKKGIKYAQGAKKGEGL